ncbi:MarR family winged helix-turn-helix transcriptional regulator [Streptomyces sp. NPDC088141]|uniref:MarR family winged helix-turn-helix transcriptional regulator n=1 Tax=unclassified Streptomyces TaxID=2593676 RepID=UPI00342DC082
MAFVVACQAAGAHQVGEEALDDRSTDPADGRVCLVAITDGGRELLAERHRVQRARVAGLLAALPEQDVKALSEAMHTALPIVRRMLRGESAS